MRATRTTLRGFRREPLPALAIIIALAVGLGAATAVFSFLDHIWLVPLPYPEADRIVQVWENWAHGERGTLGMSYPHYQALLEGSETLESVALYSGIEEEVSVGEVTAKTLLAAVTPQFFPALGLQPISGRWLSTDASESPKREAVVSRRLWRRLFGEGELNGQSLRINAKEYPVVGIMPDRFAFPRAATQVWVPRQPPPPEEAANRYLGCLAKRRAEVSNSQVAAEVGRFFDGGNVRVSGLRDEIYGGLRKPLGWLGGAIGAVLLVALLNAATLQFARISRRWKDLGIRAALGATATRLAGEMLLESFLLNAAAALAGFGLFSAIFVLVTRNWPGEIAGIHDFSLWSARPMILLGLLVLTSVAALAGLSAWFVHRLRILDRLNLGQQAAPLFSFRVRLNGAAVSAQLSACAVLLICAGLLTRSFVDAVTVDLGYEPESVLAVRFELPEQSYPNREVQRQALDSLAERLQMLQGVEAVGFASTIPVVGASEMTVQFPGRDLVPKVAWAQVTPSFFQALGLRLVEGSLLPAYPPGERSLVVNQSFARTYLGPEPIGKAVLLAADKPYRVGGVVRDVLHDGYLGQPQPGLYFHYLQPPRDNFLMNLDHGHLILRLHGRPSAYASSVLGMLKALHPEMHVEWIRPMTEILAQDFAEPRFWTILAVCLSLLALVFSMIALYAMMSYNVSQRIPELAVRMTLGATPAEIKRLVMRNAVSIIGRGLLAGVILSLLVSALFADLIFGVVRLQALTWLICLGLLSGAALLAAYLPTRSGAEADPALCLRSSQ